MNLSYQMLILAPVVALAFGHPANSEEPQRPNAVETPLLAPGGVAAGVRQGHLQTRGTTEQVDGPLVAEIETVDLRVDVNNRQRRVGDYVSGGVLVREIGDRGAVGRRPISARREFLRQSGGAPQNNRERGKREAER